jgi:hypothetical protein
MHSHGFSFQQKTLGGKVVAARPDAANRYQAAVRLALACLVTLFCVPMAFAQLTDVVCGGEGDRTCTPNDAAYFAANTRSNAGTMCDFGLLPLPNPQNVTEFVCQNLTRHQLGNIMTTNDPRGFVLHEQEQAIGADVPINLVNTLGTHNSYSNYTEGYHEDYHRGRSLFRRSVLLDLRPVIRRCAHHPHRSLLLQRPDARLPWPHVLQ